MSPGAETTTPPVTARVPDTTVMLRAGGLRKSYGDLVALHSLDLEVSAGTVLGLLGPNGAGKTTAIRILTTVLAPDSGRFSVAGVSDREPAEIRRRIGALPESAGYPPAQTAREWLVYHGRLYGESARAAGATADQLLDAVGLHDRAGTRIGRLSRGMRQRLGIARALVNSPQVLFLDEPTLGLDPAGQRQILALIAGIANDLGSTVVLSTHSLAEVEQVCTRVVILNRGRLVADGTVAEVARRAAAPRRAKVQVPPGTASRAVRVLASAGLTATAATSLGGQPGDLDVLLPADATAEDGVSAAVRSLLDARVPVLGLVLEGGRLSDAFLAVTEEADHE